MTHQNKPIPLGTLVRKWNSAPVHGSAHHYSAGYVRTEAGMRAIMLTEQGLIEAIDRAEKNLEDMPPLRRRCSWFGRIIDRVFGGHQ